MRVLFEYGNKRVDIKTPISMRQKIEETPAELARLINEALGALNVGSKGKKSSGFDAIAKQLKGRV